MTQKTSATFRIGAVLMDDDGNAIPSSANGMAVIPTDVNGLQADFTQASGVSLSSAQLSGAAGVALTPVFAKIAASSSGANQLVALTAGKKIRVIGLWLTSNGTVNAKFQSNSTDLTGFGYEVANTGLVLPFSPIGWFETAAGEALNLNLSAAIAVGGSLVYVLV